GAAFVLLQHLDPSRSSQLAELLERSTEVPVVEIEDGMTLDADRVHVIPPGHDVTIEDGHLRLTRSKGRETAPRVIDAFFRELASVWQHNAVGIILSGTGSDGTLGLKAIRAAGGLILVQNPDTAEFDGMPPAAVRGALPDDVLDTRELSNTLRNHLQQGLPLSAPRAEASADAELASAQGVDDDTLSNALEMLRNNGEHD